MSFSTERYVEIYSDVICPWCYVGKRRFEAAVALLDGAFTVRLIWKPFELNPTMPAQGMDRRTYLEAKFGSAEAAESVLDHVRAAGRQVGIAFAFDRIPRTPNTFEAHRLIWSAARQQKQDAMVEQLFHGYFEAGSDLSDHQTLVRLADRAGIAPTVAASFLASEEGIEAVRNEEQQGMKLGIRAVPYFHVADQPGLSGAHPPPVIAKWLRQSLGRANSSATTAPADRPSASSREIS